jgi:6-phosphofructokinase
MGRSAGFIAAHATLASGDVDLCLIPEVPIDLGMYLEGMLTQGARGAARPLGLAIA